ncbi:MAG: hypothetical protein CR994_05765 [Maribacter sp.]|nr:MAG: hypothetical protein CR994_05765 [Maribacter sp.]
MALKTVFVVFENESNNYYTSVKSVNGKLDNKTIINYFKDTYFDVGTYPNENFQRCIGAKIVQHI